MIQKFSFLAVTKEGNHMSGSVMAETIAAARVKLSKNGLSVLSLAPYKATKRAEGIKVFDFEAKNKKRKIVTGTIEEKERYEAFKKLSIEYNLDVTYVIPSGLQPNDRITEKKKGIAPEWKDQLAMDIKQKSKEKKESEAQQKKLDSERETARALAAKQAEIDYMHEKVEEILREVIPILTKNEKYLDVEKNRYIQENVNTLSRLKRSNASEHLRSLTKKLLTQLSDDSLFLKESEIGEEDIEGWRKSRAEFSGFSDNFEKTLDKGLADVQSLLSDIDIDGFTRSFRHVSILETILTMAFFTFSSFLGFCALFWVIIILSRLIGTDPSFENFFLQSGMLWYATILTAIFVVFFILLFATDYCNTLLKRLMMIGLGFGLVAILTFEFPLFFFWV